MGYVIEQVPDVRGEIGVQKAQADLARRPQKIHVVRIVAFEDLIDGFFKITILFFIGGAG